MAFFLFKISAFREGEASEYANGTITRIWDKKVTRLSKGASGITRPAHQTERMYMIEIAPGAGFPISGRDVQPGLATTTLSVDDAICVLVVRSESGRVTGIVPARTDACGN